MIGTALYFAVVIFLAYRIGNSNGLAGIALFLIAFVLHQMFVFGPESLLTGDCYVEWDGRGNTETCE